jgi:coatomer protein complex subunit alpha (xenin)
VFDADMNGIGSNNGELFVIPTAGVSSTASWCSESSHAADHFAAGSVDSALSLLNRQIGAVNVVAMKKLAISSFLGSTAFVPTMPFAPPMRSYMMRAGSSGTGAKPLPATAMRSKHLLDSLKLAYTNFTAAEFSDCKENMQTILETIPLVVASSRSETNDLKELVELCREYITALRVKTAMSEATDTARTLELGAYFTHCNLQPGHLLLALKNTMFTAFKAKNYINAAGFARRLLELPDVNSERHADTRTKAQKVIQKSEKEGRNEHQIDYDEMNPFVLDCNTLKPIYKGSPVVKCPFCKSSYVPESKGQICNTCQISKIGEETVGLVTMAASAR